MLSSVSLGAGLKARPTPNAAPPTPSSPQQDARHCVTPDPSAAVEALEASLEACLKSAAALGGAAPTGAAARLAATPVPSSWAAAGRRRLYILCGRAASRHRMMVGSGWSAPGRPSLCGNQPVVRG